MKYLLIICSILFFFACEDGTRNIQPYYFPLEKLDSGLVYEYHNNQVKNDSISDIRYKYYKTIKTDSGYYLTNQNYDAFLFNYQYVVNEIVESGALLKQYKMIIRSTDKTIKTKEAKIIQNNTFPFKIRPNSKGVIPMEMNYNNLEDKEEKIRFVRERKYLKDTTFVFKGREIPAVVFQANEIREFRHPIQGDYQDISYNTEIYAKDLGLVAKHYSIGDIPIQSVLKDTFGIGKLLGEER